MLLSKNQCPKCDRGVMRLQQDAYSTYFSCITCGASMVARCPHCQTPSIALNMQESGPVIYCRACECANAELASKECSYVPVSIAV